MTLPWYGWLAIGLGVTAPLALLAWCACSGDDGEETDIETSFDEPPRPTFVEEN